MQWLTDLFSDPATIQIVVVLIAGLAAAALGLGILSLATGASDPIRRRLNSGGRDWHGEHSTPYHVDSRSIVGEGT